MTVGSKHFAWRNPHSPESIAILYFHDAESTDNYDLIIVVRRSRTRSWHIFGEVEENHETP